MTLEAAIRPADIEEAAALAGLGAATFAETFGALYKPEDLKSFLETAHSAASYEDFIRDPETECWVVESGDGYLLGYATAGPCDLPLDDMPARSGELKRIYLLAEAQGAGLGKALLEKAFSWLEARFDHVYLGVYAENFRAQKIYRRYGFETVGEYTFMVGKHADDEFIMKKAAPKP